MFENNCSAVWIFGDHQYAEAAELPFGGMKNSGYGRELGDMGI